MSFGNAIRSVYHNWSDFSGRASRSEFWFFALFMVLALIGILIVGAILGQAGIGIALIVLVIFELISFIPQWAVTVRRLHDIGRSGWWLLISFIPYLGGFVLFIFYCIDSQPHPNAWGPPPPGKWSAAGPAGPATWGGRPNPGQSGGWAVPQPLPPPWSSQPSAPQSWGPPQAGPVPDGVTCTRCGMKSGPNQAACWNCGSPLGGASRWGGAG